MDDNFSNRGATSLLPNSLINLSSASLIRFFNKIISCALSGCVLCVFSEIVTHGVFNSAANASNVCLIVIMIFLNDALFSTLFKVTGLLPFQMFIHLTQEVHHLL